MVELLYVLLFFPWVLGAVVYFAPQMFRSIITISGVVVLSVASIAMIPSFSENIEVTLPLDMLFLVADFGLLAYFVSQGVKHKHNIVSGLAIAQTVLLVILILIRPHTDAPKLIVDELAVFMFMLVNIVGGLIAIYALQYIKDENCSEEKRRYFIALLLVFLGVMNLLSCSNDIEWFFLAFELTTLSSFLLIRFRMDEISMGNALRALWMNQIGGVAIILGLIISSLTLGTISFSEILNAEFGGLAFLSVALFSIAAMVKGAQIPFDKWLLGAMVAPTPVSAILHSATMVKIAPFLIIKLSPVLAGTLAGYLVMLTGGLVFVAAALIALGKDNFKEILAYSTIGLLGLMILLGAMGTKLAITAALMLMLFHGIAKALLFLEAGILEKVFHAKKLHEMVRLVERGPISVFLIVFGFLSLTLPPFGAFIGKWLAIETASFNASTNILNLVFMLLITLGSVILILLYFRVMGVILSKDGSVMNYKNEILAPLYKSPTMILGFFLVIITFFIAPMSENYFGHIAKSINPNGLGVTADGLNMMLGFSKLHFGYILISLAFMLIPLIFYYYHISDVDRVKEYKCAERMELGYAPYYFKFQEKYGLLMQKTGIALFVLVAIAGGVA